jgi:hypothetical protein
MQQKSLKAIAATMRIFFCNAVKDGKRFSFKTKIASRETELKRIFIGYTFVQISAYFCNRSWGLAGFKHNSEGIRKSKNAANRKK